MPSWSRPPSRGKRLQALPGPSRSQKRWKGNRDGFQCPPQAFQSVTALGDDTAGGMGTRTGTRGHQQRLCGWDVPAAPSPSSRCHPGALQGTLWPRAGAVGGSRSREGPSEGTARLGDPSESSWHTEIPATALLPKTFPAFTQHPNPPLPPTPSPSPARLRGRRVLSVQTCLRCLFLFLFSNFFFFPVLGILVERDKSKKQQSCSESEKGR